MFLKVCIISPSLAPCSSTFVLFLSHLLQLLFIEELNIPSVLLFFLTFPVLAPLCGWCLFCYGEVRLQYVEKPSKLFSPWPNRNTQDKMFVVSPQLYISGSVAGKKLLPNAAVLSPPATWLWAPCSALDPSRRLMCSTALKSQLQNKRLPQSGPSLLLFTRYRHACSLLLLPSL